jgi:VIT1/CCC1 family predicted Fe2+/Mn2+ transporter
MNTSWKTGISFGLTSGVITTLGLMVGLHSGTHSRAIVIGGILTIAVADAMSDALGIHVSEESKNSGPTRQIWEATVATFVAKFVIAATFVVPVAVGPLDRAIIISIVWGLFLLTALSFFIARAQAIAP